jgi:hypothetical protein
VAWMVQVANGFGVASTIRIETVESSVPLCNRRARDTTVVLGKEP